MKIKEGLPAGISLVSAESFDEWYLDIKVLDDNQLYLDKIFRLLFRFGDQYPIGMLFLWLSQPGRIERSQLTA